ncbi:nucleotidyltransferase domain-containing protein [Trichothermofontia sichuanensis B231]|uniref:nucleotidyltransferase family protein n=1 Tax=Trichothermofontia sichuanensis TaxID=3045816 RepID=UPI0022482EA3|nr:nucleotidyltransferase domain-containing protein [Trichothermofontia sichuanensis]UZQ55920.1 nucleotidyltransferase domain-containing protein [Trichothermofontia sichuanensis B231]
MQKQEALTLLAKHQNTLKGFGVKPLILFGSVARDEARTDSDVDLLVEFDRPVGLFTFVRLALLGFWGKQYQQLQINDRKR